MELVIAETELELVPMELWQHPQVLSYCKKFDKEPKKTLLDSSLFFRAMGGLEDSERRGRPDLLHFALTIALDAPVDWRVWVHTRQNKVMKIDREVRLPRSYSRFVGLMEQLLVEGRVPPAGVALVTLEDKSLGELLQQLGGPVYVLEKDGQKLQQVEENAIFVVGGFPHGEFRNKIDGTRVSMGEKEMLAATAVGVLAGKL